MPLRYVKKGENKRGKKKYVFKKGGNKMIVANIYNPEEEREC